MRYLQVKGLACMQARDNDGVTLINFSLLRGWAAVWNVPMFVWAVCGGAGFV